MDLIGKRIIHKTLGAGSITELTKDGYLTIVCGSKQMMLVFPNCFTGKFLTLEDEQLQQQVMQAIADAAKKAAPAPKPQPAPPQATQAAKPTAKPASKPAPKPTHVKKADPPKPHRQRGRQLFLVHQGKSYDEERKGGYIWAPLTNKAGHAPHHWAILQDVHVGDVIFHNYKGSIVAISVAKTDGYHCQQPPELRTQDEWENDGRRVDCDYIEINAPIKTIAYKQALIEYSYLKYSPFNNKGTGNQGYLFGLNRTIARMFLKDIVAANRYLEQYEHIQEILSEETRYVRPKIDLVAETLQQLDELDTSKTKAKDGTELSVEWVRVEIPLLNISLRPGTLHQKGVSYADTAITAVYEIDERDPTKVKSWYKQDIVTCLHRLCDGLHNADNIECVIDTEEIAYKA